MPEKKKRIRERGKALFRAWEKLAPTLSLFAEHSLKKKERIKFEDMIKKKTKMMANFLC